MVVVTWAGRGLGRAYALDAARAGAAVVVNDVDGAEAAGVVAEIDRAGGAAVASDHSVADPAAVRSLVALAASAYGRLDGLVVNAGRYHEAAPWDEDVEQVRADVGVNVLGGIYCVAKAARVLAAAGRGSIVIASSAGALGSRRIMTYAATKGALASLTYAAALDLADRGVRVNAIAPVALTRMTQGAFGRRVVPSGAGRALLDGLDERAPERIAPLVTYLLSDAAADVTGQFVRFGGSRLALLPQPSLPDFDGVTADTWTHASIAAAFAGLLALQSFGVERQRPVR
ncbi:MAG: SDR family oxidoreductase [Streptosporangiales bacterium]|nr:SDR family oxidoreductase [Streptosporangiales bacterium]